MGSAWKLSFKSLRLQICFGRNCRRPRGSDPCFHRGLGPAEHEHRTRSNHSNMPGTGMGRCGAMRNTNVAWSSRLPRRMVAQDRGPARGSRGPSCIGGVLTLLRRFCCRWQSRFPRHVDPSLAHCGRVQFGKELQLRRSNNSSNSTGHKDYRPIFSSTLHGHLHIVCIPRTVTSIKQGHIGQAAAERKGGEVKGRKGE